MERVRIESIDPDPYDDASVRGELTERLGTTDLAFNYYCIGPGGGLPGGLHTHMDQEEVFIVLEGEATFETMQDAVTVGTGEAIRFGPGEFRSGENHADEELVVLALGAPRATEDIRIPASCPECGHDALRIESGGERFRFTCPGCEIAHVPENCLDCGHDELQMGLGADEQPVAVCQGCETAFEEPPMRTESHRGSGG